MFSHDLLEALFITILQRGNNLVVLRASPNSLGVNRYGFAAGKRLGSAVLRNRIKRRLREAVRQIQIKDGWDMVFIARKDAAQADYHTLKQATQELLARARLLGNGGSEV